jgi:hypothetical protein
LAVGFVEATKEPEGVEKEIGEGWEVYRGGRIYGY